MLKPTEYTKTVMRPYPPLLMSLICEGQRQKELHEKFMEEVITFKDVIKVEHVIYYAKATLDRYGQTVPHYWMKPGILDQVKIELEKREKKLIASVSREFIDFAEAYEAYVPALVLVFCCDTPVAEEVRKRLLKKISAEETNNLMNSLNIPLQDNYYKKIDHDLATTEDIDKHVKEYEWISSRYGEKRPYTKEDALKKLATINKADFLSKWNHEKTELKEVIKKAKEILGDKDADIIDFMQFIIFYRTQRTDVLNRAAYLFIPKLEQIARDRNLSYIELLHCTKDEIIKNQLPSKKIIQERIEDHVLLLEDGEIRCLSGKSIEEIKKMFVTETAGIKEVKGVVASKGKAQGIVRVIKGRADFSKVLPGDVLVTSMTTPDMVPIMNIASSFITDEGGITCHAAIVSRELKKPCIIGTKNATQILKDGDRVEVDADLGIVKIIK